MSWGDEGKQLAAKLEGLTEQDEPQIKTLAMAVLDRIHQSEENPEKLKNALTMVSREVTKRFPRTETKTLAYPQFEDQKGQGTLPKWRHLVFKYLTLDESVYDAVGGEERAKWKARQSQSNGNGERMNANQVGRELAQQLQNLTSEPEIEEIAHSVVEKILAEFDSAPQRKNALDSIKKQLKKTLVATHPVFQFLSLRKSLSASAVSISTSPASTTSESSVTSPVKAKVEPKLLTLKDLNISQLELDAETQGIVEQALNQTGMDLAEFVQRSLQVYAKTVTGKTRKQGEDLSQVSTSDLLNEDKFRTHPGRVEELTKRVIRAMMIHNDEVAVDNDHRWAITQSVITEITGSRASSVKPIVEEFKTMIDEHNAKYDLNNYSNRKGKGRDITQEIKLVDLVPDGIF